LPGSFSSFSFFLLIGTWLLDLLGLPQDFLRNAAIALLFLLAAMLIVPRLGCSSSGRWREGRRVHPGPQRTWIHGPHGLSPA
jgi:hypothetical protein